MYGSAYMAILALALNYVFKLQTLINNIATLHLPLLTHSLYLITALLKMASCLLHFV